MLPVKVGSIWPSSFRGKDVLTVANQKQELLLAAIFVSQTPLKLLGKMEPNLARSIYVRSSINFLRFVLFGQEKICFTLANQKQELLLAAIFVGKTERNEETL
jgi:hypothetical protein